MLSVIDLDEVSIVPLRSCELLARTKGIQIISGRPVVLFSNKIIAEDDVDGPRKQETIPKNTQSCRHKRRKYECASMM